ncbi:hypothetical protein GLA29479_1688 [Lysobacter antibioticus]|uniref:N-acetyltransferase domain-containing protein n=1 Tax=Lysobacter antibioticus TaxID=84531 RepID=A0A0S2DVJ2_LYSAN|nr:GNAT family N-acetyltransferase [Lysobacter antibioticus]ALN62562.1 hypothetical protein GLA29479_1688 [Lysobacter antibioticus]ALN80284.1 hypothetical protein LA76x_2145 [Lysobacter antibioticus]
MAVSVRHVPDQQRFLTEVDEVQALLEYHLNGDQLVITHTLVPDAIGGRGIAGDLVRAAFEYARVAGYKVRPACSYAAAWIQRHPEYTEQLG